MIKLYALLTKYWAPKPRSKRNLGEEVQGASGSQEQNADGEEGNKLGGKEGEELGAEGGEEEMREDDPEIDAEEGGGQDGGGGVGSGQPPSPEILASPVRYPSPMEKASSPAPLRTPSKRKPNEEEERLDTLLAWTLGGELPPTVRLGAPWDSPWTRDKPDSQCHDELDEVESQTQKPGVSCLQRVAKQLEDTPFKKKGTRPTSRNLCEHQDCHQ